MKYPNVRLKCLIATSWIAASAAAAQPVNHLELPPAASIPWADLPIYLADRNIRDNDFLGAVRYIPLSDNAKDYFSLGGEVRYQYQDYERTLLGVDGRNSPNSMLQQRLRLSGDLNLSNGLRVFAELGDNREFFAERETPVNRGETDVQQMFVELSTSNPAYGTAQLRLGRFVMPLGSVRLVGLREGVNYRYTYDGAKFTWVSPGQSRWELFSVNPTRVDPSQFDDQRDKTQDFSGIYGSRVWNPLGSQVDVFAYSVGRDRTRYTSGAGEEQRNTYGARFYGQQGRWDHDIEAALQNGSSGGQRIRAWALMTQAGYTFADSQYTPRLGIRANAFSGDGDRNDNTLGDFVAPAVASGLLFTDANWFTAINIMNIAPVLSLKFTPAVQAQVNIDYLMRQSTDDGIYYLASGPLAPSQGSARHIATNYNFILDWRINRFATVHGMYTHASAGRALEDIGGTSSDYFGVSAQFLF
ncbi:alginate export family protein [Pseudomonas putida]